jgi:hypothetical protein
MLCSRATSSSEKAMFRVGGAVVLAIAILAGCGKRETDSERRQGSAGDKGREATNIAKTQLECLAWP